MRVIAFLLLLFIFGCSENAEIKNNPTLIEETVKEDSLEQDLFLAISKNKSLLVEGFISMGANVDIRNENGYTPLCYSVLYMQFNNQTNILKSLIEGGADMNKPANNGKTPIIWASGIGNIPTIELLLSGGADINYNKSGSALMEAARMGNVNTIKVLIDNGADIKAVRPDGKTALDIAIEFEQVQVIDLLKSYL